MPAKSQNGWPVTDKDHQDQGPFGGVTFPNGILAGDVATIARWQLARYEATVETLVQGTCWGWFVKPIEGSTTISNHASGTAWDINANKHPMGKAASSAGFNAKQIKACRAIVAAAGGVLRWGGDYTGRPDAMHWEIVGTKAQAAAFAARIKKENSIVTPAEIDAVANAVVAKLTTMAPYTNGGGQSSPVGRAVINSGYPIRPGAQRTDLWAGLQTLQVTLDEARAESNTRFDAVEGSLTYIKSGLDTLTDE